MGYIWLQKAPGCLGGGSLFALPSLCAPKRPVTLPQRLLILLGRG